MGTPTSLLQFSSGPDQPTPYGSSNYVFSGQSFGSDNAIPFWSNPSSPPTNYPNDTITGGDLDDSNKGYVFIPKGRTEYLATVQFFIPQGTQGNQFQISLVNDPGESYFDDRGGNPLQYSSGGGLVTISSVPEPYALVMAAISSLSGLLWYCCRRMLGRSPNSLRGASIRIS